MADLPKTLYHAFGLEQGTVGQMFRPEVWACGLRAMRKGHGVGRPIGDPWMMPGFFLVRGDQILWSHISQHAADHPSFAEVGQIARGLVLADSKVS